MLRNKVFMDSLPEGLILLIGADYEILGDSQPRFAQLFVFRQVQPLPRLRMVVGTTGGGDRGAEVGWEVIAIVSVLEVEVDVGNSKRVWCGGCEHVINSQGKGSVQIQPG